MPLPSGTFASSGMMNLFIQSDNWHNNSGIVPLLITGNTSGFNYKFGSRPLFIQGGPKTSSINLFISGNNAPVYKLTNGLNLTISGHGTPKSNSTNLYISGSSDLAMYLGNLTLDQLNNLSLDDLNLLSLTGFNGTYANGNCNLYIKATGINDSWYPKNASMNLFLSVPSGQNGNIGLYIYGKVPLTNYCNLFLPAVSGVPSGSIPLYVRGKASLNNSCGLYLRGF